MNDQQPTPSGKGRRAKRIGAAVAVSLLGLALAVPAEAVPKTVTVTEFAFTPASLTQALGQNVVWNYPATNFATHTSTDNTGLGLWDSGFRSPGTSFTFTTDASGTFAYHCAIHLSMLATLKVTDKVTPATGTTATVFKVSWATAALPPGYAFDVQVKTPTSAAFVNLLVNTTLKMTTYTPTAGPGVYQFRSLVKGGTPGGTSTFSPPKKITVT